jgi:FkbM family methyltransferase
MVTHGSKKLYTPRAMPSAFTLLLRLIGTVRNWPVLFLNKAGWLRGDVVYRLRNGFTVTSRRYSIDGSALNEVWLERCYDPQEFRIPFAWSKVRTVVDCGGHIGTFTLYAAAKSPRAKIVTLEPDAANYRMLEKNLENNKLEKRVTLLNVGLGDGRPVTLYTFPQDRGGNSVYRKEEGGIPMTIRTVSLHEIFTKYGMQTCDYLKLDCEGAEYDALYALDDADLQRIKCIGMEYHHFSDDPTHNSVRLEQFLINKGFRVIRHRKSMLFAVR